jgi:membrane-bound lytic murein transglycosylase D
MFITNLFNKRMVSFATTLLLAVNVVLGITPSQEEISRRVQGLSSSIDIRVTEEVLDQVTMLCESRKRDAETILGRTHMFFPMIEQVFSNNDVPLDLKYIAVIESSLIPFVKSRQGASGMWQFMEGTAEMYDLKMSKYVDERMDVAKSTEKAAAYLKRLYRKYNDWTLVLAAYNCGDGTVDRAIKKSGQTEYWSLAKHLPTETQKYVPRFIAAMYLDRYYYDHDINPRYASDLLTKTATIKVYDKVDFKKVSKELDLDMDYIKFLNPTWRKEVIPQPDSAYHTLTLPREMMLSYVEKFSAFEHLIDPISSILALENANPAEAQEIAAEMRSALSFRQLKRARSRNYAIRDSFKDELLITDLRNEMTYVEEEDYKLYKLKRKETLTDVARNNNVTLTELMELNGIRDDRDINPGSIIKVK